MKSWVEVPAFSLCSTDILQETSHKIKSLSKDLKKIKMPTIEEYELMKRAEEVYNKIQTEMNLRDAVERRREKELRDAKKKAEKESSQRRKESVSAAESRDTEITARVTPTRETEKEKRPKMTKAERAVQKSEKLLAQAALAQQTAVKLREQELEKEKKREEESAAKKRKKGTEVDEESTEPRKKKTKRQERTTLRNDNEDADSQQPTSAQATRRVGKKTIALKRATPCPDSAEEESESNGNSPPKVHIDLSNNPIHTPDY